MESLLLYGIVGLVSLLIIVPYYLKLRKQNLEDLARQKEAVSLGIHRPMAQHPFIDTSLCIGCGSCVAACPEGDVLGMVYGKAQIINGLRCVGHAYCEKACPVGAVKVGLGDVAAREDIPLLDQHFETNVPGLFIAGELGGMSLIRNAILQGETAVRKIAQSGNLSGNEAVKDVVIIGAGAAGLSAALTAIQHKLSYAVLDQQEPGGTILQFPRRKLVMTQPVKFPLYGWLRKQEYHKEELLEIWEKIIRKYQVLIYPNHKVEKVRKINGLFEVKNESKIFQARHVVLALGRRGTPRKLDAPGEELPKVMYQLIDAQSYQHENILIVGGGDSAVEAAIALARQKGNTVTISYRREQFFRIKKRNEERIERLIREKKIRTLFNSNVVEIKEKSVFLQTENGLMEIPNSYVLILIGGTLPFDMLKEMGITFGGQDKNRREKHLFSA